MTDKRIAVLLLAVAVLSLWTLLGRIAAYQQAVQLGEVALALLGVVLSGAGFIATGGCVVAMLLTYRRIRKGTSEEMVAQLVRALQEIQGIPRMPDYGGFGCGYNGALYTVGKIAGDALAAVGVEGSVGE